MALSLIGVFTVLDFIFLAHYIWFSGEVFLNIVSFLFSTCSLFPQVSVRGPLCFTLHSASLIYFILKQTLITLNKSNMNPRIFE